jgi:hypothetical protein
MFPLCRWTSLLAVGAALAHPLAAQSDGYPVTPKPLADSAEIALAESAAPRSISSRATIYSFRNGKSVVLRTGTNGCTCLVSRDLHGGSLYPICFDREATRTRFPRELMEVTLRVQGKSEDQVRAAVAAEEKAGRFPRPTGIAVVYMMSPRQVLFSSPLPAGVKVGRWWPHLMITGPGVSKVSLGMDTTDVAQFSVDAVEAGYDELVVKLPAWSDGTPAKDR